MRRVHVTIVAVEKQKVLHICVCVRVCAVAAVWACVCVRPCVCVWLGGWVSACTRLALLIQHATHIRHIVICSLSGSTTFFILSHKQHDFRGKSY
jgi:hypothetical protein